MRQNQIPDLTIQMLRDGLEDLGFQTDIGPEGDLHINSSRGAHILFTRKNRYIPAGTTEKLCFELSVTVLSLLAAVQSVSARSSS